MARLDRGPHRRSVLRGALALALSSEIARARARCEEPLPRRRLGRTGRDLPVLGIGCYPLGGLPDADEAVDLLRHALESGARYVDTAPSYGDGESERRVGRAIRSFPREELYVATKTLERDGDAALAELEGSLERLGSDYVDSVQVHEVHGDVERIFAKGGVLDALEAAREKKKLRHIGVTGHRNPAHLVRAIEGYDFATALVPVNPLDPLHRSFVKEFLPKARERGVAVLAMKVYAGGALAGKGSKVSIADLVRFALAQEGVCVGVPGADSAARWDQARAAAVLPLPEAEEQARLVARAGPHRGKASEWYKDA